MASRHTAPQNRLFNRGRSCCQVGQSTAGKVTPVTIQKFKGPETLWGSGRYFKSWRDLRFSQLKVDGRARHSSMDADRRHETPASLRKGVIARQSRQRELRVYMSAWFRLHPEPGGAKWRGPGQMLETQQFVSRRRKPQSVSTSYEQTRLPLPEREILSC